MFPIHSLLHSRTFFAFRMESNANNNRSRKRQKRKLDDHRHRQYINVTASDDHDRTEDLAVSVSSPDGRRALLTEIAAQVTVLGDSGYDRPAVKRAAHVLAELAKNEEIVNLIVEGGAVPALVKHLVAPSCMQGDRSFLLQLEHEVEKGCAFALGLLAVKDISLDNVSSMHELSEAFSAISLRHPCISFIREHFDKFIPGNGHLIE